MPTSPRRLSSRWISLVAMFAAACSSSNGSDASVDASSRADAAMDGAAMDGSVRADASRDSAASSVCPDAGIVRDGAPSDAAVFACPTVTDLQCDAPVVARCWDWAQQVGAGLTDPSSICVTIPLPDGGSPGAQPGAVCARADFCGQYDDLGSCLCGRGPACGPGQVCARRSPCEPMECLPCRADYH